MVVVARAGCKAAVFLWIFSSISCKARTSLPSRKSCSLRSIHNFSSVIRQGGILTVLGGCLSLVENLVSDFLCICLCMCTL